MLCKALFKLYFVHAACENYPESYPDAPSLARNTLCNLVRKFNRMDVQLKTRTEKNHVQGRTHTRRQAQRYQRCMQGR